MIPRKRVPLSGTQRSEVWRRWKAGESLHAISRAVGKDHVISRGIASDCSLRMIAQQLKRAPSTVSREVARHGGRAHYRAGNADSQAWESALRPKTCLLARHAHLRELVTSKLLQDWSPQQISGWLKMAYPNDRACACRTKRFIAACSSKRAER